MRGLALALLWLTAFAVPAHELRPAYLELHEDLHEDKAGEFDVLWKTPMRGDLRLALTPTFSGQTETLTPVVTRRTGSAAVQTWRIREGAPLRGQTLSVDGLPAGMTDALVRIQFADGTSWLHRLTPQAPSVTIPSAQTAWSVAGEYLALGVEHILLGPDHLLFVLALLLITRGGWKLVKTVTAFTAAHSITLALAALGFVHVAQAPVEALIALSIVFVALEILRQQAPRADARAGLAHRAPWLLAFAFGLLHGFGFAGALSEIGLPEGHIPMALLFFNLGVEVGQLLFIAAVLGAMVMGRMALARHSRLRAPRWTRAVLPYTIGGVAMFWVIQRVTSF